MVLFINGSIGGGGGGSSSFERICSFRGSGSSSSEKYSNSTSSGRTNVSTGQLLMYVI